MSKLDQACEQIHAALVKFVERCREKGVREGKRANAMKFLDDILGQIDGYSALAGVLERKSPPKKKR